MFDDYNLLMPRFTTSNRNESDLRADSKDIRFEDESSFKQSYSYGKYKVISSSIEWNKIL